MQLNRKLTLTRLGKTKLLCINRQILGAIHNIGLKQEGSSLSVNSIVRNAAKCLCWHQLDKKGQFYTKFVQATQHYDSKSKDFHFALVGAEIGQREIMLHVDEAGVVGRMNDNDTQSNHFRNH